MLIRMESTVHTLIGHKSSVTSVAFSPDTLYVASQDYDCGIRFWDTRTGECIRTLAGHEKGVFGRIKHGDPKSLMFSPNGRWLASGGLDKAVKIWDVGSGEDIYTFSGHKKAVSSVAFSTDGHMLASGSGDKTVKLWDMNTGQKIRTLEHVCSVESVAFSPDSRWLASAVGSASTHEGAYLKRVGDTVQIWELATGRTLYTRHLHEYASADLTVDDSRQRISVHCVAFSPDGRLLAAGGAYETIKLWEADTGRPIHTLGEPPASSWVHSLAFEPHGRWLASSLERTAKIWDMKTRQPVRKFSGHTDLILSVAFSSDGRWLASGSQDKTVRLWRLDF